MRKSKPSPTRSLIPADTPYPCAASVNAAVARCCKAWSDTYEAERAKGQGEYSANETAGEAYRDAMPTLSSPESVRDFIACAAHGILLGAIEGKQGSQLLYAAQVASCMFARLPREAGPTAA